MMLAIVLTLMLGCNGNSTQPGGDGGDGTTTGDTGDTGATGSTEDLDCPTIDHDEIDTSQPLGEAVEVSALVTDISGVFIVELYYKKETTTTWNKVGMALTATDTYTGQIPGTGVGSGGMDYYIKAVDQEQNGCTAPREGEDDPFHFRVNGD